MQLLSDNSEVKLSVRENPITYIPHSAGTAFPWLSPLEEGVHSSLRQQSTHTTIRINKFGINKADSEVVQHSRLMKIAEGCEVIFTHKYVRVS